MTGPVCLCARHMYVPGLVIDRHRYAFIPRVSACTGTRAAFESGMPLCPWHTYAPRLVIGRAPVCVCCAAARMYRHWCRVRPGMPHAPCASYVPRPPPNASEGLVMCRGGTRLGPLVPRHSKLKRCARHHSAIKQGRINHNVGVCRAFEWPKPCLDCPPTIPSRSRSWGLVFS
jgi:hypothetical protein